MYNAGSVITYRPYPRGPYGLVGVRPGRRGGLSYPNFSFHRVYPQNFSVACISKLGEGPHPVQRSISQRIDAGDPTGWFMWRSRKHSSLTGFSNGLYPVIEACVTPDRINDDFVGLASEINAACHPPAAPGECVHCWLGIVTKWEGGMVDVLVLPGPFLETY